MKRLGVILFSLTLIFAQPVAGQFTWSPDLAPQLGPTVTYQFFATEVGWGNRGPYIARLPYPGGAEVNIYCVDRWRSVGWNDIVTANVVNLNAADASFNGLYPEPDVGKTGLQLKEAYQKAAYLAWMMSQGTFASKGAWDMYVQNIHIAMWHFTSGVGVSGDENVEGTSAYWAKFANDAFGGVGLRPGFNVGEWSLLATTSYQDYPGGPVIDGKTQYMLTQSVVPEPQTYVLMGTGLVFLVFFGRRRLKEMGYA
jgi:hypothetical protein